MASRKERREIERNFKKVKKINYAKTLYKIKYQLNKHQADLLIRSIPDKNALFGNPIPKEYKDLRKSGLTFNTDELYRELSWYTHEIFENAGLINTFLLKKNEFEVNLLKGNYEDSIEILEFIESELSISEWSIVNRLLLSEYSGGFTKNKEILSQIINDNNAGIVNLLANYYSRRVEKQQSFSKFNQDVLALAKDFYPNFKEYLIFKLSFFSKEDYGSYGSILNLENPSAIIDKYETLINVITIIISRKFVSSETLSMIRSTIINLSEFLHDSRLQNMLFLIEASHEVELNKNDREIIYILDLYTTGNYEKVIKELSSDSLFQWSNIFPLYIIFCKSYAYLNKELETPFEKSSIANTILEATNSILLKDFQFQSSITSLKKITVTFGLNNFSLYLRQFVDYQSNELSVSIDFNIASLISSSFFNPSILVITEETDKVNSLINSLNSSTIRLLYAFKNGVKIRDLKLQDIENYRRNKYELKHYIKNKNYDEVYKYIQYFDAIPIDDFKNNLPFNKISLVNEKVDYFLHNKQYTRALNEIVENNLINANFASSINANKILELCLEQEALKSNISTPILFHQYYPQYVTKNFVWISLDNFLNTNNLHFPKDIITKKEVFDNDKLIYFLKNICIQDIYDSSIWFENQDELDNERIEICTILSEIDNSNFENYISEISEIDRNLLIRKGVKQIDESKIYVDISGLKKSLYKDLNENLQRSINLQSLSIDQLKKLDLKENNVLITFYDQDSKGVENIDSNIKITGYSRFQLFVEMFLKLRDNFIANNDYGLDTYLSMRIRHGTLLGEFRSNFEKYHLVTKKENQSRYKENQYWKNIVENDEKLKIKFNQLLSEFSEKIDNISNDLKNNKIQINTENKKSSGYFDFSYTQTMLFKLFQDKFAAIKETDIFIEEALEELWNRTEKNLHIIREFIAVDLKEEITGYINDLNKKIDELIVKKENSLYTELVRNLTNCKTDVRNELDKISSWFRRTNNKSINDFNIQLPIDSTVTTIKRIYKDYSSLNITTEINCTKKIEGEFFQHFCYIFQNLIHNVIEHSNLTSSNLKIHISIEENSDNLSISIQNNLSENILIGELNNKISNIIIELNKEKNSDKIRNESGTGYIKINKTIYHDLRRNYFEILITPIDENRIFKCQILMDNTNLYKRNNENIIN